MSHSITYKDIDFGGINYGLVVVSRPIQRLPAPRVAIDQYAQRDGAAMQGATFDARRLSLACAVTSPTVEDLPTRITNIMVALATSQASAGDLIIQMDPTRVYTNARLLNAIDSETAARMEQFNLEFACDPWPEAASAATLTGNISATGTTTVII
jgi:predicted phage tail component-like protein